MEFLFLLSVESVVAKVDHVGAVDAPLVAAFELSTSGKVAFEAGTTAAGAVPSVEAVSEYIGAPSTVTRVEGSS